MPSKSERKAALAKFKAARQGTLAQSSLDQFEDKDDDDIYDYVDEETYKSIVQARREREDFVVDDDGLGYYDDGEERYGDEAAEHEHTSKKRSSNHNASLTQQALKKARKNMQLQGQSADPQTEGNKSMWDFVNKGVSKSLASSKPDSSAALKPTAKSQAPKMKASVDDLLGQLDEEVGFSAVARPSSRRRKPPAARYSRMGARAMRISSPSAHGAWDPHVDEDDDDDAGFPMDDNVENAATPSKSVRFSEDSLSNEEDKIEKDAPPASVGKQTTQGNTLQQAEEPSVPAAAPRRRLVRPKLEQVSKAAQKAMEEKQQLEQQKLKNQNTAPVPTAAPLADITSASFQPTITATDSVAVSGSPASNNQIDLREITQKDGEKSYVDMFWMDIQENRKGEIYLFGKVQHQGKFVSACLLVTENVRNIFVLPREGHAMMDVHGEINEIMHASVLPRVAGASWAGKVVKRQYAFNDPTVPREETEYLKVVYNAKYPAPAQDLEGTHFSKILNAGASLTETFLIKRKLMGPCWIRVEQPQVSKGAMSWCRVEMVVHSPKLVLRLDEAKPRPPPPVVSMSIKLKTVTNAKTQKNEIVSVSAICHRHVMLETASDDSPKHMTQISIIRPLDGQFPRDLENECRAHMPYLKKETNERALLSLLLAQIGQWDPDVIVGHNAWGFDMEVLLARCAELKVKTWSKLGRRRRMDLPNKTHISTRKDLVIAEAVAGRLLCDTYLSAKELLRETTYSLTNLAATQLKTKRQEIEPVDIPQWFQSSKTIVQLALSTLFDAQLVTRLMFKLQILPLTKQLTCIAGNIWSHTLKSNRAERTEYLLLHEFHRLKFLPPEKRRKKLDAANGKAKYSGGLVLEPKKGLYDSFILLLDFNSLYPSIIQEYNLCFTTIDWSKYDASSSGEEEVSNVDLPPTPDESVEQGVLPRVIKTLVERRRAVKKMLKTETSPDRQEELDIRQKALKLTANSMYGCLGFSNSRFFAQPIAAMVTAMGRETLQRTVNIAQDTVGLDVIYGDTDSIMINTRVTDEKDLGKVRELGERVKREVNRLYKTLELEIDGIFRTMLLLKKKKYAAKTVEMKPDGSITYGEELKGLDLVRRDWCIQSKDTGRYVTEQILSGQDTEIVLQNIHNHLEELAKKMRSGELPLEKYTITKGLSKHPNDYPDAKSQPHVHVAKSMLKNNRPVNTGDHIPYIITAALEQKGESTTKAPSATERARHPEEISRSNGVLKPDIEWYLTQQILPPIARLCEPIEGTSQQILAEKLGLDAARYNNMNRSGYDFDEDLIDYTPSSMMDDAERFKEVDKLNLYCASCNTLSEVSGVLRVHTDKSTGVQSVVTGLQCPNPSCARPAFWGHANPFMCYSKLSNAISIYIRGVTTKYYEGLVRCDETGCGLETHQLSVAGGVCLRTGCHGRMQPVSGERAVYDHLKYLESLFNTKHACEQLEKKNIYGSKSEILKSISRGDKIVFDQLHASASRALEGDAYNWISPGFWRSLFSVRVKQ